MGKSKMKNRADFDSYRNRPAFYESVSRVQWEDWKWQQQNAIRTPQQMEKVYPSISNTHIALANEWLKRGFRFQLTPYIQSIVERDKKGNPKLDDPIFRQFFPAYPELLKKGEMRFDEYSPNKENWEIEEEMLTPIAHHKYDNRVILYLADVCLAYCGYCLRSLQSTAKEESHGGARPHWDETLKALQTHPEIEEVILSGGDPLVYDNGMLENILKDLHQVPSIKAIRIHTRSFTHNPYRIDTEFCRLLKKYDVTELGIHVSHPNEMTKEFLHCIEKIRQVGAKTLLLAQIPLIKGVNDNVNLLHRFFMDLYVAGIKPYYFLHNMPNIPAAATQRTNVRVGLKLMNALGRKISHPAMPEYIIVHRTGKRTVPIEMEGTDEFKYTKDKDGNPIIRFKNWKGNWETYQDGKD